MTITSQDWRALSPAEVAPLLAAEADAWRRELAWDVRAAWRPIEPARLAGALPGVVVRDDAGVARGWTCFLDHRGVRQVAMLVADVPAATAALLQHAVNGPDSCHTTAQIVCVRDAAPGLADALRALSFDVGVYRYLSRECEWSGRSSRRGIGGPPERFAQAEDRPALPAGARAWRTDDLTPLSELCARSYASSTDVRAFAPNGTCEEWMDYVSILVGGTGCGRLVPESSFVVTGEVDGQLDAAIITTDLGCGTAHIAQLVVDPGARGRGLGRQLVDAVVQQAGRHEHARVTLLVAESNRAAGRLYDAAGFSDRAQHIVALRRPGSQPRRSNNVAEATGGASTRR